MYFLFQFKANRALSLLHPGPLKHDCGTMSAREVDKKMEELPKNLHQINRMKDKSFKSNFIDAVGL